jgi:hypothetical protein
MWELFLAIVVETQKVTTSKTGNKCLILVINPILTGFETAIILNPSLIGSQK